MGQFLKPWRRKFGVIMLLLTCLFAAGWHPYMRLREFGSWIDFKYATEIEAFKASARKVVFTKEISFSLVGEAIRDELNGMFDSDVFYSVVISMDGHHGLRAIKRMPENEVMWHSDFGISHFGQHRKLSYGKSSSGQRLLFYQVFLHDAPVLRWIEIVFSQDEIAKQMNPHQFRIAGILYWPCNIMLTVISLWLLFSKPRNSTQMNMAVPIPAEGA